MTVSLVGDGLGAALDLVHSQHLLALRRQRRHRRQLLLEQVVSEPLGQVVSIWKSEAPSQQIMRIRTLK